MTDTDALATLAHQQIAELEPASLDGVRRLGRALVQCEADLAHAEAEVKRLRELREELRVVKLPELFFRLGITVLGGMDGSNRVLRREPLVAATLPKEPAARERAVNWIVDHRHGGVVKRRLLLELPKGDAVVEHQVVDAIAGVAPSLVPVVEYDVHHQTYLALCRRLVAAGGEVPLDVLGIFVGSIVRMEEEK